MSVQAHAALLKRFDHPAWQPPAMRALLRLKLSRLSRVAPEAVPGLALVPDDGVSPPACRLFPWEGPTLDLALPLAEDDAQRVAAGLAGWLWASHQNRVSGLRFAPALLALGPEGDLRWLAPDLAPEADESEAAQLEDLRALAGTLEAVAAPAPDGPLARAIDALARPGSAAARLAAMREALGDGGALQLPDVGALTLPVPLPIEAVLTAPAPAEGARVAWLDEPGRADLWCDRLASNPAWRVAAAHCPGPWAIGEPLKAIARQFLAGRYPPGEPLPPVLAPLACLLPEWGPVALPALSPALARLRVIEAFAGLVLEPLEGAEPVLVFHNYEQADELTRAAVDFLIALPQPIALTLVLASEAPAGAATPAWPTLSREEWKRLTERLLGDIPLTEATREAVALATEGDVALLVRLCQRWLATGALIAGPEGLALAEPAPEAPPAGTVRDLLRAVATLGGQCSWHRAASALGLSEAEAWQCLEAALDAGWLVQRGPTVAFWLPREAQGCYTAMGPESAHWHRRAAEAFGEEGAIARAWHARRGDQPDPEGARALAASAVLFPLGCLELAGELLEAARDALGAGPARSAVSGALAVRHLESGRAEAALPLLTALVKEPGLEEGRRVALWTQLARARRATGDTAGARSAVEAALAALEDDRDLERARLRLLLANVLLDGGEAAAGQALAEEAMRHAHRGGDEVLVIESSLAVCRALLMGPPAALSQGLTYLDEVIERALPAGHLEAASQAYLWLAHVQLRFSQLEGAHGSFVRHRELARALRREREAAAASVSLAWLSLQQGYFEAAVAELDPLEPLGLGSTAPELEIQALTIRAVALLVLGYLHDPLRLLDEAQQKARALGDQRLELVVLGHLVYALLFLGKFPRAKEVCQQALARAGGLGEAQEAMRLRLLLAELAWRQGDGAVAEQLLMAVRHEAEDDLNTAIQAEAHLGLARLALSQGRIDEARRLGQLGHQAADAAGSPRLVGEVFVVLGEVELADGALESAQALFDSALGIADATGSPHHRALALFGLSLCASDAGQLNSLRARAAENLNVYIEQLTESGQRDFLRFAEREQIFNPEERARPSPAPLAEPEAPAAVPQAAPMLEEVLGLVSSRMPLEELVSRLNEAFMRLSHATRAMVYLVNEDGHLRLADRKDRRDRLSVLGVDEAFEWALERARTTGATLWVRDTAADPELAGSAEIQQQGIRSLLCIPLKVTESNVERVIGVLYGDSQARWLGVAEAEIRHLELLARYTSVMVEVGMLEQEAARKANRLEMLNRLSRALAGTLDLDHLLELALGQILQITQGEQGYVFFGTELELRASRDLHGKPLADVHVSRSVIARVKRDRQPLAILDIGQDEELVTKASLMVRRVRSVMCVPLLRDDQLVGLIYITSPTANRTFTRNDLDLTTAIAAQVALALQSAQAYATIKELNQGLEEKVRERTSELTQAYQELTETQAQLVESEKLATIGTLAAGVAHEINNPLGAILTNAQLLMLDIEDADQRESLSLIEEGARRCKEIVSALLRYSKEDRANHGPVDMLDLTEDVLTFFGHQWQGSNIEVEARLSTVPSVMGELGELRQVVTNLFLNAHDAITMRHGAAGGHIKVTLLRDLAGVVLTVEDDGQGMATDVQRRIFDPFFTTKQIGSGQGLGLSVCQRIVEKHGGRISVRSAPNEGATFTVVLPVP